MLVHIVPGVPPAVDGLGDYCYQLWQHWPVPRPDWHCLVAEVPAGCHERWPEVGISGFERSRAGLRRALDEVRAETVVLHYVGYGYHPKGVPVWLPLALRHWKNGRAGRRLIVMFHELYANGKPWQSSFWARPAARQIMCDLSALADRWVTSCPEYHSQLIDEAQAHPAEGALIPVGANLVPSGAVDFFRPWPLAHGRKLRVVIFGQPNTRLWALQAHRTLLRDLRDQDLVESILLLGRFHGMTREAAESERIIRRLNLGAFCQRRYDLPPADLSKQLLRQDIGLVANWPGVLTKSLVYANLCAHGVLPIAGSGSGKTGENFAPCAINDTTWPHSCIDHLRDESLVADARRQIKEKVESSFSWGATAEQWVQVCGPSAT